MILVSTGNKELHSETSLDGIGSSGHDFSHEFLINVLTSSVKMLNSVNRIYVFRRFIRTR